MADTYHAIKLYKNGSTTSSSKSVGINIDTDPTDITSHALYINGDIAVAGGASKDKYIRFYNRSHTKVGSIKYDSGNATNVTTGKITFYEYSPNSTADTTTTGHYEGYSLPTVNTGRNDDITYDILTTKNTITTGQGGTGNTSATANHLVYAKSASQLASDCNLEYFTGNSTASSPATYTRLHIYGNTYGNTASNMISGTAGLFSWGDGGPQITFDTNATPGGGQAGALIFTDHDTAATGASWHFVSNQSDWNVISKRFHARTSISIGSNLPKTNVALNVTGTVQLHSTEGSYREGIRIYPYSNWATIILGGNDLSADSGTSANSWSIHNNNGNFYLSKNGSDTATVRFQNSSGVFGVVGSRFDITANSNTVSIGSQNSSWCHIYNSANIPFIFNNTVATTSGDLGTTTYKFTNAYFTGNVNSDGFVGTRAVLSPSGSSWCTARDNSAVRIATSSGYTSAMSVQSNGGDWSIGQYNSSGFYNQLLFSFVPDSYYSGGTNTYTVQYRMFYDGGTGFGIRNINFGTSVPSNSAGANGDIFFKY